MKFLIDAQLPRRFAQLLCERGHDAVHTTQLPLGNRTPDSDITALALRDKRIVVTKDSDFVQSFLLTGHPALLFMATGNISNFELERLLLRNFEAIERAFRSSRRVEMTRTSLIVHE